MGPIEGGQKEPRAPRWLLSTRQLSQLPANDASRQLAREGAQNNPDSCGGGCHGHRRWAASQDTWNPVLAASGGLVTLGESLLLWLFGE